MELVRIATRQTNTLETTKTVGTHVKKYFKPPYNQIKEYTGKYALTTPNQRVT